jgi:hypothetical protein
MTVVIDRVQRDALWALAASDLDGLGDALHHAGARRELVNVEADAWAIRLTIELLDCIGWPDDGARRSYKVTLRPDDLERLLLRWRQQLDDAMGDQAREPLTDADRDQVDDDLDARLLIDRVLTESRVLNH